jgi:CxxC motif-containing protein (DUF1111 family)
MKRVLSFRILASIGVVMLALAVTAPKTETQSGVRDALNGSQLKSNGFAEEFCANQIALMNNSQKQGFSPLIDDDECSFDAAAEEFTGPETPADGLGPVFNMAGCAECHFTPFKGGSSHITEKRAGFYDGRLDLFTEHSGGSLIQDRALDPSIQETVTDRNINVLAARASISTLGDGFVEAISNSTLEEVAQSQPAEQRGLLIKVAVFEKPGQTRYGRFGWKNQQASLLSFSADAYVNEMGITSPLQPDEPTSNGTVVKGGHFDGALTDPNDDGVDVALFALFMRSLQAPKKSTQIGNSGNALFNSIGCGTCHTNSLVTAPPGTIINGGALKVANALGNKKIFPFSDYLMHDIGTGDGIVQNGGKASRNMIRTAPLWGLRSRGRLMHDGGSLSINSAIQRHGNQADRARDNFNALSSFNRSKLLDFLNSL